MSTTFAIAPVRKSVTVNAPQARAFAVFTEGLDRWWPRTHGIGTAPMVKSTLEPRVGGRWHTLHADGSETVTGIVKVWDAPKRIVFSWDVNANWKPDTTVGSEVEVNFTAVSETVTRVDLEHRKFEALGAEGGKKMAGDVNGGWPRLLEMFKAEAEKAG